jgi:hypothetical protein
MCSPVRDGRSTTGDACAAAVAAPAYISAQEAHRGLCHGAIHERAVSHAWCLPWHYVCWPWLLLLAVYSGDCANVLRWRLQRRRQPC